MASLDFFQAFLILLVDLGNSGAESLAGSGVLLGEENAEARTHQQANQADYHGNHHRYPAPSQEDCHQGLGGGDGGFDDPGRNFGRLLCCLRGFLRLGPRRLHPPGGLLRGLGGGFRLGRCLLTGLDPGAATFRRLNGAGGGFHVPLSGCFDFQPLFTP